MGTTMDDVREELYLEDLHKSYINALEKLVESKTIKELQANLEDLEGAKASLPDWMDERQFDPEDLRELLSNISTVESIYKTLIKESKKSKIYFWSGITVGIIGLIFSMVSILK